MIDANTVSSLSVNIYDVTGKLVASPVKDQNLTTGENIFSINTSELNSGIYFVTLNTINGKETVKLVVSK